MFQMRSRSATDTSSKRARSKDPGVVDEDIEPTQVGDGFVDGSRNGFGVGAVGLNGNAAAARGLDLGDDGVGLVGRADVGDRDVGAVTGKSLGDGGADAAAATGDECYFAIELRHGLFLCNASSRRPASPGKTPAATAEEHRLFSDSSSRCKHRQASGLTVAADRSNFRPSSYPLPKD